MATFTNHITNLSTLSTALTALCREFEPPFNLEPDHNEDDDSQQQELLQQQREEEAEEFLHSLVNRVDNVDEALMKSTEYLLPTLSAHRGQPSRMTATELSQVLSSLHEMHAQKIELIESLLAGSPTAAEARHTSGGGDTNAAQSQSGGTPYHWSLGMPLEKVVETDNETDRNSFGSVSSRMMRSPSLSQTATPSRQGPRTPRTPSIRGLRLSASTAVILTQDLVNINSPEPFRSNKDTNSTTGSNDYNDEAADDEDVESYRMSVSDSMTTLSTRLDRVIGSSDAMAFETHQTSSVGTDDNNSRRSNSHTEDTNTQSNGDDDSVEESTLCPTVFAEDRKLKAHRDRIHQEWVSNEEDNETFAESTICSTVVARNKDVVEGVGHVSRPTSRSDNNRGSESHMFDRNSAMQHPSENQINGSQHDISQVVLDDVDASPSQTFLTMDATMHFQDPGDSMSQSSKLFNDAASLGDDTPVLDRYRIISDDSSVGFKVLPNERGSQRKIKNAALRNSTREAEATIESISALQSIPKTVRFGNELGLTSRHSRHPKTSYSGQKENDNLNFAGIIDGQSRSDHSRSDNRRIIQFAVIPKAEIVVNSSPQSKNEDHGLQYDLQQKTPSKTSTRIYRTTPYSKYDGEPDDINDDGQDKNLESRGSSVRFDSSSLRFDTRTPAKHQSYRKTPHAKTNDLLRMPEQSVKFCNNSTLECLTPSADEPRVYRKTPCNFRNKSSNVEISEPDESVEVGHSSVHFALPRQTPQTNGANRKQYKKTPYSKTVADENSLDNLATTQTYFKSNPHPQDLRSPLRELSETPQRTRLLHSEVMTMASPSSTITGLTGVTFSDNQRELFPISEIIHNEKRDPARELALVSIPSKSTAAPERLSYSSLKIPKISETEYSHGDMTMQSQHSLDELNKAIEALNGVLFLRGVSEESPVELTENEAKQSLKKVGDFRSRKAGGLLKALCHWNRLTLQREFIEDERRQYYIVVLKVQ